MTSQEPQGERCDRGHEHELPPDFQVIPAVDLLGDEAVRLEQGSFERVTIRAGSPEALVRRFAAERPTLIHIVDLEGARNGRVRPAVIAELAAVAADVPIQASGGIRSIDDAQALLEAGAARVIVGTAAFSTEDALAHFVDALDEQLVVAVDARDGMLRVGGWEADGELPVADAARRCATAGAVRIHCTAIDRDGTMAGPDIELLREVREASGLRIIAAGGIRSSEDLAALATEQLEGAVVGRALLEGAVPLAAIRRR